MLITLNSCAANMVEVPWAAANKIEFTQPVAGAASTGETSGSEPPTNLTAEGLLLYCQIQLGSLDDEIDGMMKEQLKNLDRKKAINKVEEELKKHQPPKDGDVEGIRAAYQDAIDDLPEGDPVREVLEQKLAEFEQMAAVQGFSLKSELTSKENWGGYTAGITNLKDEVSGNAELEMITLQSLVSKRQTAISLASGIMGKIETMLQRQAEKVGA